MDVAVVCPLSTRRLTRLARLALFQSSYLESLNALSSLPLFSMLRDDRPMAAMSTPSTSAADEGELDHWMNLYRGARADHSASSRHFRHAFQVEAHEMTGLLDPALCEVHQTRRSPAFKPVAIEIADKQSS